MLGQVAQLTHPKINEARYQMLTVEEYMAHEDKYHVAAEDRLKFDEKGIPV